MEPITPSPVPVPIPLATPIAPPTSLLHPSLMEKLRLGSPTPAHMDLTTLNRHQSENEINKTLYGLQEMSPFPKLPPYFVHPSEEGGSREDSERSTLRHTPNQTPPHAPRKRSVVMNTTPPLTTTITTTSTHNGRFPSRKDLTGRGKDNTSHSKQKGKIHHLKLPKLQQ